MVNREMAELVAHANASLLVLILRTSSESCVGAQSSVLEELVRSRRIHGTACFGYQNRQDCTHMRGLQAAKEGARVVASQRLPSTCVFCAIF